MNIGKKIRDRRNELGLTLEQVGDACGVGKATVLRWETGAIQNMRRDKLAMLAAVLQLNPTDLLETPEEPQDDAWAIRERLRRDPEYRMLFSAAAKATPDHLRAAAEMLKALEPKEFPDEGPQEFPE